MVIAPEIAQGSVSISVINDSLYGPPNFTRRCESVQRFIIALYMYLIAHEAGSGVWIFFRAIELVVAISPFLNRSRITLAISRVPLSLDGPSFGEEKD